MKNYLNIYYYIKTLYREGTVWEFKRILGSGQHTSRPNIKKHIIIKRLAISTPAAIVCYLLKQGLSSDFVADMMAALSIFIGLFTNVIFVVYNRFAAILPTTSTTNNAVNIENTKLKNFIRQFTFVTGKNLLVATIIIFLLTLLILFDSFYSQDIADFKPVHISEWRSENILKFLRAFVIVMTRFTILYLVIDFFILLLYSLGALFAFLKREMI